MGMDKFDRLEEGLGRLLYSFETLRSETLELRDALEAKDLEIASLKENASRLEDERIQVRKKVDSLLAKLDGLMENA